MEETAVAIVGAGSSGLATSSRLTQNSIPRILLEREGCCASLWRKNTSDRVNLHLAKEFGYLPLMPHPPTSPTFLSKKEFIPYIDEYVAHFNINPCYCGLVESALYVETEKKWRIETNNTQEGTVKVYEAKFLVVATGENSEGYIPDVPGLDSIAGQIVHSKNYKSAQNINPKRLWWLAAVILVWRLLVTSTTGLLALPFLLEARKDLVHRAMLMLRNFSVQLVDAFITFLATMEFADLSNYGIYRPKRGTFYLKQVTGRSPVIDVGTIEKIKEEAIKDYNYVLKDNGWPKNDFPNHWKGEHGLYCAGFSRRGLFGVAMDAEAIVKDINETLKQQGQASWMIIRRKFKRLCRSQFLIYRLIRNKSVMLGFCCGSVGRWGFV